MERYFNLHSGNESLAIEHYRCNILLAEALYTSISVFEVTLRNALCRELSRMTGRADWYAVFPTTPGLAGLNYYITQATRQILARHEIVSPSKITAELTFGFWVSLLNSEYERVLWKDLRRAFAYMPKSQRQRKNVSTPLNTFRRLRNRVFHNESICWNLSKVQNIHADMTTMLGWINKDVPEWLRQIDRFDNVCEQIKLTMKWQ